MAFHPDGTRAFVVNLRGDNVSIIDGVTAPLFQFSGGTSTFTGGLFTVPASSSRLTLQYPTLDILGDADVTVSGDVIGVGGFGATLTINGFAPGIMVRGNGSLTTTGTTSDLLQIDEGGSDGTAILGNSFLTLSNNAMVTTSGTVVNVNGGSFTTQNTGHVVSINGGTLNLGDSVLALSGANPTATIAGDVVSITGSTLNGPTGAALMNVSAGAGNISGSILNLASAAAQVRLKGACRVIYRGKYDSRVGANTGNRRKSNSHFHSNPYYGTRHPSPKWGKSLSHRYRPIARCFPRLCRHWWVWVVVWGRQYDDLRH